MTASVFLVALGGALGAVLRFLAGVGMSRLVGAPAFPVAILAVNVIGSLAMGVFAAASAQRGLGDLNLFVMTGILGGFTTFSAFSLETVSLIERGDFGLAGLYVALSVGLSVGALAVGMVWARGFWA